MTHINAFHQDVEDAKVRVGEAKAELDRAKARLQDEKLSQGIVEKEDNAEGDKKNKEEDKKVDVKTETHENKLKVNNQGKK